jgi:hypothetical protein
MFIIIEKEAIYQYFIYLFYPPKIGDKKNTAREDFDDIFKQICKQIMSKKGKGRQWKGMGC